MEGNTITQQIMAIQRDLSLTDVEKAKKRQELLSGKWAQPQESATGALFCMQLFVHYTFAALAPDLFKLVCQIRKVQQLKSQHSLPCSMTV